MVTISLVFNHPSEAYYPANFRAEDRETLADHLTHRHSVVLIGAKRVGISNFLRFFLTHIKMADNLFVSVDLNDLVEREIFPFWRLLFKRIVDCVENSPLDEKIRKKISQLFTTSIQSNDLFLTVEGVRESLFLITQKGLLPTIFLIRFDRLKDVVTEEFFNNLKGLKEATSQKLSYVFTSFRKLEELSPQVFKKSSLLVFVHDQFIKPASQKDIKIIFKTFAERYKLIIDQKLTSKIIELSGGHVQYLQLMLIVLHEALRKNKKLNSDIIQKIVTDERIALQSEELVASLTDQEQEVLDLILRGKPLTKKEISLAAYLWDSGLVVEKKGKPVIFSPLLINYLKEQRRNKPEEKLVAFSKKENLFFNLLKAYEGEVCEREKILEVVWPEYAEIGVSDWAIDRLAARLRKKLKLLGKPFRLQTVKTRGFMLIRSN